MVQMCEPRTATVVTGSGEVLVAIGEATPQQQQQCYKLAAAAFASPLSQEDYLKREEFLGGQPSTRNNGWRLWCVYPADNPEEILATCKTIDRELLVKTSDGISEGRGYCIASVVTEPKYRKCGLSSLLLRYVGDWMDGPGEALASMLYTSIGDFYALRGWAPLPAYEYVLTSRHRSKVGEPVAPSVTRLLTRDEIVRLCEKDVETTRAHFAQGSISAGARQLAILPTAKIITWLHDKAAYIGQQISGRTPQAHGSICNDGTAWVYWYHDFRKNQLALQKLCTSVPVDEVSGETVAFLLLRALEEAENWGLARVVIWDENPSLSPVLELLSTTYNIEITQGQRVRRSIPSLRWPEAMSTCETSIFSNEFFAWS